MTNPPPTPAAISAVLAVLGLLLMPGSRAHAFEAEREDAATNLRVFAGGGNGIGGDGWLGRRLRLEASVQSTFPPVRFALADVALVIPLTGDRRSFSGIRAGYQLQYVDDSGATFQGSRISHAPDVGYVFHVELADGTTIQADLGVEAVYRASAVYCCDHAPLATTSYGIRAALMAELGITSTWGLYGHFGVRTADHLLEVKILPTLAAGLRARF